MACSLSSPTSSSSLGDPQRGGALFILPREVRDGVYRSVVKGCYCIPIRQGKIFTAQITVTESRHDMRRKECNFALFRVSKAISHEASEIWLSESVFSFTVNIELQGNQDICLPAKLASRLKSVELYFPPLVGTGRLIPDWLKMESITAVFKAAIAPFTGSHILRNSLTVEFTWTGLVTDASVLGPIFEAFKETTGFTTVSFRVDYYPWGQSTLMKVTQVLHQIGQLGKMLEPTLGPATECHERGRIHLTFHPQKYLTDGTGKGGASV